MRHGAKIAAIGNSYSAAGSVFQRLSINVDPDLIFISIGIGAMWDPRNLRDVIG